MKSSAVFCGSAVIVLTCLVNLLPSPAGGEEFGGFGIVVAQLYDAESPNGMGGIVVLHVPQDSEAFRAGMRAGDVILEVDGRQTSGREFGDIVLNSLRGRVGSSSDLKIRRAPENRAVQLTVRRSLVTYTQEPVEVSDRSPDAQTAARHDGKRLLPADGSGRAAEDVLRIPAARRKPRMNSGA